MWGALLPVLTKTHVVLLGENDDVDALSRVLFTESLRDAVIRELVAKLKGSPGHG